jgi:hypothetical protein
MDIRETNRAKQIAIEKEFIKGVKLIDIDTTIAEYMNSTVIPELIENEKPVRVPLVYGNAERWEGARQNGYLRDERRRRQIPLIMFKRNSVERNESMEHFREQLIVSTFRKYSKKNRYDRFSLQNNTKPSYEQYHIAMPAYVTVTYEVMIWTSFTEHMNQIVEQFQYASDRYWGKVDGFKFRAKIDSFENQQEVGEGSERLIRTTFNISVNAYLLPEMHGKTPVVKQDYSKKRVVFGIETDLTGGDTGFTSPTLYNEYAQVIDFVAVRGSQMAEFVNSNTVKLVNVKKPILPSELVGAFDIVNWFRIYINGDFISPSLYTYTYNGTLNEITFTFTGLTFAVDAEDEVAITGKFQEL